MYMNYNNLLPLVVLLHICVMNDRGIRLLMHKPCILDFGAIPVCSHGIFCANLFSCLVDCITPSASYRLQIASRCA